MENTNIQMLTQIATLSPMCLALAFILAAFLRRVSILTVRNSICTYGTLVGFRRYRASEDVVTCSEDFLDNKKGCLPLIEFEIDGETAYIASSIRDKTLTRKDLGKQVKIRYREFIGVTMIIDEGDSMEKHNQREATFFWIFMGIATMFVFLGLIASTYLPGVLKNI